MYAAESGMSLEKTIHCVFQSLPFSRIHSTCTLHSSKKIQNNDMLVWLTRPRVVEYCLGALQAHLQNKCVITKYDYCGWYGCRVPTILLRPHPRTVCYEISDTSPHHHRIVYGTPFTYRLLCADTRICVWV